MKVKEKMSRKIIAADKNDTAYDIAMKMKENNIGFLPICEGRKIIGVLTDRDICTQIVSNNDLQNIANYIKKSIICIDEEEDILKALEIMKKQKVKRLLVTKENKVTGILALSDLLHYEDKEKVLETVQSIFETSKKEKEGTAEIDSFYL